MLNDFEFRASYNKLENNIADEFYLPCMRNSVRYDRVSGYFGSTIYIIAWDALKDFIKNDGHMRIVCSPVVSDDDARALSEGYSARTDAILTEAIEKEVTGMFNDEFLTTPNRLLAYLVCEGIVDVKLAVPSGTESAATSRMFHDKVGLFTDEEDNTVGFRGSMNETFQGLSSDGNIESIDVFPSWMDTRDCERVYEAEDFFNALWNEQIQGVAVYPFPGAAKEILKAKSEGAQWEKLLDEIKVTESLAEKWKPNHGSDSRVPKSHQIDALEAWDKNGRRGILEHATGSGKTYTAMCAINAALEQNESVLILVPSINLLNQWDDELHATLTDYHISYLLCGAGNTNWKTGNTLHSWTSKIDGIPRITIATMDTASSEAFMSKVAQGNHLFLVADEVHNLGSTKRRKALKLNTGARLGLSATPRRYGDPTGTEALLNYFNGIIPPPFTLQDAINSGVLTKYFYYPQKIRLTAEEQEEWDEVTKQVKQTVARMHGSSQDTVDFDKNPRLKQLLIKRARIVKNASGKVSLALKVLKDNFKPGDKWIVYCDNIEQLKQVLNQTLDAGFDAYEYYSDMKGDRDTTVDYFTKNGGVLVSIKCLDEGVDIPSTTHALILASSQNPREFIQRRGRILRKAPEKSFARLYDAITVPVIEEDDDIKGLSIITAELSRAIQFGEWAENPSCVADLKNIAVDFNIDYEDLMNGGYENDDE